MRLEALRGWGRHQQSRDCQPMVAAVADPEHARRAAGHRPARRRLPGGARRSCRRCQKAAEALPPALAPRGTGPPTPSSAWRGWPRPMRGRCCRASSAIRPGRCGCMRPARRGRCRRSSRSSRLGSDAHDNVREAAIEELARLKRAEALAVAYEALDAARLPAGDDGRPRAGGRDRQAEGHGGAARRRSTGSPPRATTPRATRAWRS